MTARITIDKRILSGGSILEVTWDNSAGAGQQTLIIHTGQRQTRMPIPPSGTKRLRMRGGSLLNWVGIETNEYGRVRLAKRRFIVVGKQRETDHFEYMDRNPLHEKMGRFAPWLKRWWGMYPPEKQRLYIIALLLFAYQLLVPFAYPLASLLLTGTIFYIFWLIVRR